MALITLPIFSFSNAGANLDGIGMDEVTHSILLGVKLCYTDRPKSMSSSSLYGMAVLCGIGFTMSFFIGSLAFEE